MVPPVDTVGMLTSWKDRVRVALSRAGLRRGEYSGDYERLKRLYRCPDPWHLANAGDRVRFERTNALIANLVPRPATLLELGAGEGLQTAVLARLSDRITGIELSHDAIVRARQRVPGACFVQGRAEDIVALTAGRRFTVATVCEMLYYVPDPAAVLAAVQRAADHVVVTNYARLDRRIAFLFAAPGWQRCADIRHGRVAWHCYHWTSGPDGAAVRSIPQSGNLF